MLHIHHCNIASHRERKKNIALQQSLTQLRNSASLFLCRNEQSNHNLQNDLFTILFAMNINRIQTKRAGERQKDRMKKREKRWASVWYSVPAVAMSLSIALQIIKDSRIMYVHINKDTSKWIVWNFGFNCDWIVFCHCLLLSYFKMLFIVCWCICVPFSLTLPLVVCIKCVCAHANAYIYAIHSDKTSDWYLAFRQIEFNILFWEGKSLLCMLLKQCDSETKK